MTSDWAAAELAELKYHWGSAYMLWHPEPDVWVAQRRDTYETLRADGPDKLLQEIRDDYAARPVPRRIAQRPQASNHP